MKKQDKIFTVENLVQNLKEAKTTVLADYRGLTVGQMTKLRSQIKKSGGQLLVVKNTLLKRALEEAKLPVPSDLTGPTAVALGFEDEVAIVKTIFDFAKETSLPSFKIGIWKDKLLSKEELGELGQLPGKEILFGKLLSLLVSPSYRLVNLLTVNQKKLVYVLSQKAKGGE